MGLGVAAGDSPVDDQMGTLTNDAFGDIRNATAAAISPG